MSFASFTLMAMYPLPPEDWTVKTRIGTTTGTRSNVCIHTQHGTRFLHCTAPESGWLAIIIRRCASLIFSSGAPSRTPRMSAASRLVISGRNPPCTRNRDYPRTHTHRAPPPHTAYLVKLSQPWGAFECLVGLQQCSPSKRSCCHPHADHQGCCLQQERCGTASIRIPQVPLCKGACRRSDKACLH